MSVACSVATRCADPSSLALAVDNSNRQTQFPERVRWRPCSIADGDAGIALMCGHVNECVPNDDWGVIAHRILAGAVEAAGHEPSLPIGLFGGLSGLGFAALQLSRGGERIVASWTRSTPS